LAAGFDKNALMLPNLHRLGFSFAEIGTVTARPQPGNARPRLFRLPRDGALINRMGFNNHGADVVAERLQRGGWRLPLGGNIGKSKITPIEKAADDYVYSFERLSSHVDFFVVNVSSPNTPGLRQLQDKQPLRDLLRRLSGENREGKPIFLKIAPDVTEAALADIVDVAVEGGLRGLIVSNTTVSRQDLTSASRQVERIGAGGLSGAPLRDRSTRMLAWMRRALPETMELIGVGGVFHGRDALEKIYAGARAVQIYTALVYRGPRTVARILTELLAAMDEDGVPSIAEAIGSRAESFGPLDG
jgi:dihydroorotate dehydrogenase